MDLSAVAVKWCIKREYSKRKGKAEAERWCGFYHSTGDIVLIGAWQLGGDLQCTLGRSGLREWIKKRENGRSRK